MIELVSIGDRVENGTYRLQARFRSAMAFALNGGNEALACVVAESKGAGPVNIVVRGFDFAAGGGNLLEVQPDLVVFDGALLRIRRRYDSLLRPAYVRPEALESNLRAFKAAVSRHAPLKSLAFLLDERREEFGSGLEREFAKRMRAGVERLMNGDTGAGAAAIYGLGFGLTPSGDDFLAGFLLGLHALESAGIGDFAEDRRAICRAARGGNPFSRAFLRCAAEGRCFEHAAGLIQGLFAAGPSKIERHTERLMAVGASSGADLAVGLLFALRKVTALLKRSGDRALGALHVSRAYEAVDEW